eukprot:CAMPEP_0197248702 /NCGR_PEP_ID=MMETSP1429-20130617/41957_1 /TAXON_ID=49237 /ORGANISM="Chaetoceros  sp., Strain UNC1202" /LENGTH=36 /DNA_ID= /DNA_START= /DNA_END= /DNA_ORIENTATION=
MCKLANGAWFGEQLTLSDLKIKLMGTYEEHAATCSG